MQKNRVKQCKRRLVKPSRGITLIALVVTIVVLLILAGVSIVVLFGDNGMIKTAEESTLQTKLSEIEERANIAYADLNSKKYAEDNPNKKITMLDIKAELEKVDKEKYQIRIENPEGSIIKGIILNQTSIKLGKGDKATIKATFDIEENSNTHYYVKVEEKYYEISIKNNHINLDKTNGKTKDQITNTGAGAGQTKTITATSSDKNVAIITEPITQLEDGASIEIIGGTTIGEEATITVNCEELELEPVTCKVIVKMVPISEESKPNGNQAPIQNGYGKIDILWLDENDNIIEEPKAPILQSKANPTAEEKVKMTPIKWNGTGSTATLVDSGVDETNTEITKADGSKEKAWYDYNKQYWANAITENGSYFVWIPRYAYRITYYESKENQETPVGYCDGYGMWRPDGTLEYKLDDGIDTVEAEDGNLYIVHPAFGSSNKRENETDTEYSTRKTKNIDNGGWAETLTGFWFAKFEMSQDKENLLASVPGVKSITNKTIGEFYTMGRTATYGQTGTADVAATDGITGASFMNSHMIKNSEWGAVAYLAHSKYGLNGEEVAINGSSGNETGGGNLADAYLSNQSQSTTGNAYGVYDMSGGTNEYTAIFNNTDSYGRFGNTSKWTENTKITTSSNSTKYATKYINENKGANCGNIIYTVCKIGDGMKEVYLGKNNTSAWFKDSSVFLYPDYPFLVRGGSRSSGTNAGLFYTEGSYGPSGGTTFRAALCP